jgi:hypothetical protein
MESPETVELENEEFVNRTGIMNKPELGAELIRGAEELTPRSDGDAAEINEMRAEYMAEGLPIGSEPVPVEESGEGNELAELGGSLPVLLDKLGERLAFERQGTRLYEAFLQKVELLGSETENGPTAADLRHICDEEFEHFRLLQQAIAALGGDATVLTPSTDVAGVLSKGVVEIVGDPRTTLAQTLQAMLTAELVDNDGWQMLNQLAAQLGLEELEEQARQALQEEQEHLEKVRGWLLSITRDEALGGGDFPATEDESDSDDEVEVKATAGKKRGKTKEGNSMDALEVLKEDHERVKELFEQVESTEDDKEKRKLFKEIKKELDTHARIEETVFYPAMQEHEELKDMVLESLEEHKQVKKLLREIDRLGKTSEKFEPKLKVLQENVEHHAEEEEEGKMFPKIRELINSAELEELGNELEAAKSKKQRKAS